MYLDSDLADLRVKEISPFSPESDAAIAIYSQELFLGVSPEEIRDNINGLTTNIYFDEDGKPVGVSSVDSSNAHMGEFVLEWMAVDKKKRGIGYGKAIIGIVLNQARNEDPDGVLLVTAQTSTIDYYTELGAHEDDDGQVYFDLQS